MAEKYYNKKPPDFGITEWSGGFIFVREFPVFFLLNLVASFKQGAMPKGQCRPQPGSFCFFKEGPTLKGDISY
jgi:hypothetical protein